VGIGSGVGVGVGSGVGAGVGSGDGVIGLFGSNTCSSPVKGSYIVIGPGGGGGGGRRGRGFMGYGL
jgi:hypothetical protein